MSLGESLSEQFKWKISKSSADFFMFVSSVVLGKEELLIFFKLMVHWPNKEHIYIYIYIILNMFLKVVFVCFFPRQYAVFKGEPQNRKRAKNQMSSLEFCLCFFVVFCVVFLLFCLCCFIFFCVFFFFFCVLFCSFFVFFVCYVLFFSRLNKK